MTIITASDFHNLVDALGAQAQADIAWAEECRPPEYAEDFALEAIFVICNSGMQNVIARAIFDRVVDALCLGHPASAAFGHVGKARAIEEIWRDREKLLAGYLAAEDKLAFCASLPWIGEITKYHLAKNFGAQVAKPDVHLQRIADREGTTPQAVCERLAKETGLKVPTIDTILWRACANGLISKTGEIVLPAGEAA